MSDNEDDTTILPSDEEMEEENSLDLEEEDEEFDDDDDDMSQDYEYKYDDDEEDDDDDDDTGGGGYNRQESQGSTSSFIFQSTNRGAPTYQMKDSKTLRPTMLKRINSITDALNLLPNAAGVIMRNNKWKKDQVIESFFGDPKEQKRLKTGVQARCISVGSVESEGGDGESNGTNHKKRTRSSLKADKARSTAVCQICFDDEVPMSEMYSMPCKHSFCMDCWKGYMDDMINDGPTCLMKTCPSQGCSEVITEVEVKDVTPQHLPKYESYQLRSFVEVNDKLRWCPGPGCESVAVIDPRSNSSTGIICNCEECRISFCHTCGNEPHAPLSCTDLQIWTKKCQDDSETANWMMANTKNCPKCSTRIEKNQGCNHMTCRQCQHHFCWICMGPWSEHGEGTGGYYSCNKYDESKDKGNKSDAESAKNELDRYLHYYTRYHGHSDGQKFAQKQLKLTEGRMSEFQDSDKNNNNTTWADLEFLQDANEQIVKCRRVLKYTYGFAFQQFTISSSTLDSSKTIIKMRKDRFEHLQLMLESFTEKLSELTEKPLHEVDRAEVVNQTSATGKFMENLLKYANEDMD